MNADSSSNKTQKLLFDAAGRIAVHDDMDCKGQELVAELQQPEPLSATIAEIAALYDIPPADVLEAVILTGCRVYWWNGKPYEADGVKRLIRSWSQWDATPEVEVELTQDQRRHLEEALGDEYSAPSGFLPPLNAVSSREDSQEPLRKFTPSDSRVPDLAAPEERQQRLG